MNNKIEEGKILTLAVSSGVVAGDPVVVGGINGVASIDRDSDGESTVDTEGVFDLSVKAINDAGSSAVAIGDLIYYVSGDTPVLSKKATAGTLFGVALETITSGSTDTIKVLIVKVANTDTGIASAHIVDAAQTQTALVDNGGGTADGTVASQAAPTTLTDSTGYSGTHDDTVAATAAVTTLTDSTGGSGSHDDTLDAITTPTNVTDSSTGSTADTTLAEVTNSANAGSADITPTKDAIAKLAVLANAAGTAIGVLKQNQSDVAQKIIELVTREAVHAQNVSNVAQKVIELVTLAGTAQNNLKEVTTELALVKTDVGNLVTKVNAILLALEKFNVLASS